MDQERSTASSRADDPQRCDGCDHPLNRHVHAVSGRIVCLCSWTHTSTTDVIGLTSHHDCDCVDFVSPNTDYRRAETARKDAEMDGLRQAFVDAALKRFNARESK